MTHRIIMQVGETLGLASRSDDQSHSSKWPGKEANLPLPSPTPARKGMSLPRLFFMWLFSQLKAQAHTPAARDPEKSSY